MEVKHAFIPVKNGLALVQEPGLVGSARWSTPVCISRSDSPVLQAGGTA